MKGGVGTRENDISLSHAHLCQRRVLSPRTPPDTPGGGRPTHETLGVPESQHSSPQLLRSQAAVLLCLPTPLSTQPALGAPSGERMQPRWQAAEVTWRELTLQQSCPNPQAPQTPAPTAVGPGPSL